MINGTIDIDSALASIESVLAVVREERWSVEYTHTNAHTTGRILSEKMSVNELIDFAVSLRESTTESKENIDKVLTILQGLSEILEHYTKLSDIGYVWRDIIDKNIEDLKSYQ